MDLKSLEEANPGYPTPKTTPLGPRRICPDVHWLCGIGCHPSTPWVLQRHRQRWQTHETLFCQRLSKDLCDEKPEPTLSRGHLFEKTWWKFVVMSTVSWYTHRKHHEPRPSPENRYSPVVKRGGCLLLWRKSISVILWLFSGRPSWNTVLLL